MTMNNSPMYRLSGYVVGWESSFGINISLKRSNNPEIYNDIHAMKQQIKENSHIQFASQQLEIYKIDQHPIHLPNSQFTEAQQEEGVREDIIDKFDPQPKNFNYVLLNDTRPITSVWSQQPDTPMKVHFMVVIDSHQALLQVDVTLTIMGLEEIFREVSMSLKKRSTIRDLSAKLKEHQISARAAFDFYDAQGSTIEEDEQLIDGARYYARLHPTSPATPIPPHSTRAVPYIYRTRAIKSILQQLMYQYVMLICAPPACGKTFIAEQVKERYAFYFKDTYLIDLEMYRDPSTAQDQIFTDHAILLELCELATKQDSTLIIIDGAQNLNFIDGKYSFWGGLKLVINPFFNKSLYILMLGECGEERPYFRAYNRLLSFPIAIPTLDFPTIHMDDEEFNVMVDCFNNRTLGIQLTGSCRDYIRNFLGGHIGLVTRLLQFLDENPASHNLRKALAQAPDELQSLVFITEHAFNELLKMRSIPTTGVLAASKVPYLLEVKQMLLLDGGFLKRSSVWQQHTEAIASLLTNYCITSNGIWWSFASPFIQFALLKSWRIPADRLPDFHEFIQQCIQSLDYAELGETQYSFLADLLHEDPFKCALYAKMPSYLPIDHHVDPEVGQCFGSTGRFDLWIWPAKWAIEIFCNYDAIKARVDRSSSTYSPLPIEKRIVLNFVQEQDQSLKLLTIRNLSQQQQQDQKDVWHIHWSPRAQQIVLRINNAMERLPILENALDIEPATVIPTTVV
ncbi:hypothetical protein C0992_008827 [Termitomyces sp. T32_za158]|nr:hypothetical protein C0992_008827 [Termitomyces sp. T32_za158]